MNCKQARDRILRAPETVAVQAHLATCSGCREFARVHRAALVPASSVEPPAALDGRVRDLARQYQARRGAPPVSVPGWRLWLAPPWRNAWIAVAACAVLVIGFAAYRAAVGPVPVLVPGLAGANSGASQPAHLRWDYDPVLAVFPHGFDTGVEEVAAVLATPAELEQDMLDCELELMLHQEGLPYEIPST